MKGEKGVTVMIGLLGPGKEMGKESDSLARGRLCQSVLLRPQDEIVNKGNKQKAILTANYGPKEDEEDVRQLRVWREVQGLRAA
jgi:hypothetical protein